MALVTDCLLQVGEDFLAGPDCLPGGALPTDEVVAQRVVALFVDLVGVVVEIDRRDFVHVSFQAG